MVLGGAGSVWSGTGAAFSYRTRDPICCFWLSHFVDSGSPFVDSGSPFVDSGTLFVDSGTHFVDSGMGIAIRKKAQTLQTVDSFE